ncbi:MAG: cytochrome c [Arenicellales bacterium]
MRPLLHVPAAAACLFLCVGAQAAGNAEKGELRAQTCMGCHGAPGERNAYPGYRIPKLGGQHDFYIVNALKEYKEKKRWHPTMRAQASTLTEQDRENVAAYFSSMAKPASNDVGDNTPFKQCAACHGPDGNSPSDPDKTQGAPILAGQYPDYIVQVLHDYKSGKRQNPIMNAMASGLNDEQIHTIAEFLYRQKGLVAPEIAH